MARRPRCFAPGLLHHVVARGNRREPVFLRRADFLAYLARLRRYSVARDIAGILAYCLMPNHVHLLIRQGPVSLDRFMQGLQQSYTQYFNCAHAMVGHVFQGRYKAFVCQDERYLAALVRYIHLNPLRAGIVTDAREYPHSSHMAYLRGRTTRLLDPRPVLEILGGHAAYRRLMAEPEEGLPSDARADDLPVSPLEGIATPARPRPPADGAPRIASELARRFDVDPARLRSRDRSWHVCRLRSLVAFALVRGLGYSVGSAADALDHEATAVSMMLSRLSERMSWDPLLAADAKAAVENVRL